MRIAEVVPDEIAAAGRDAAVKSFRLGPRLSRRRGNRSGHGFGRYLRRTGLARPRTGAEQLNALDDEAEARRSLVDLPLADRQRHRSRDHRRQAERLPARPDGATSPRISWRRISEASKRTTLLSLEDRPRHAALGGSTERPAPLLTGGRMPTFECDICIVGGGTSAKLAKGGGTRPTSIIVVETGDRLFDSRSACSIDSGRWPTPRIPGPVTAEDPRKA